MNYSQFLIDKSQDIGDGGFDMTFCPDMLFDFQAHLSEWSCRKGRTALFADCGLGKTPMQLTYAENVVRHTNKPVLILTPPAVSSQTVREGEKFGVEAVRSIDGKIKSGARIIVTNYERLHYFNPHDFAGVICDESSILKNAEGVTRAAITEFMRTRPYRMLATATAAPNDYIEFGTSSEALGYMGYMDMLSRFFKHDNGGNHPSRRDFDGKFRFRGHAERKFWRYLCGWSRALRKPSDLGFKNAGFDLPPMNVNQHVVECATQPEGWLFAVAATRNDEQLQERRRTLPERCEMAASLVDHSEPAICWAHLNPEADLLEHLIPDAVQVAGADSDDEKEEKFRAFSAGEIRVMVTKPKIGGFGINWQHCAHQTFFPSHSFEQWYQCVRRSWRFGQKKPVTIDIVTSEGEANVLSNLMRKSEAADVMFSRLVELMNDELHIDHATYFTKKEEVPSWL